MEKIPDGMLWPIRLSWGALIVAAIASVVAGMTYPIVFGLAIGAVIVCLVFLTVLYLVRRNMRRGMEKLFAGECWAHWNYDPGTWSEYARVAYAASKANLRRRGMIFLVFGIVFLAVVVGYSYVGYGSVPIYLVAEFVVIVGGVLGWTFSAPWRLYRRNLSSAPEAWIGPGGLYHRRHYLGFGSSCKLKSVEYKPGEWPELIFHLLVRQRYGWLPSEEHMLVPRDRQAEAAALAERFRGQIVGAA